MTAPDPKPKRRPPASLFALGHAALPAEVSALGVTYQFVKLFKHDFFAATGLYERADGVGNRLAVLKVQRTYPYFGWPMRWLGRRIASREIRIYQKLQNVPGIPKFLGAVGPTGFLHEFIPGTELAPQLPLSPQFFADLERLFKNLHEHHIAYVDANKRENILFGDDGHPWLIDFQISYECAKGARANYFSRRMLQKLIRADWYHFYKHKTRLIPKSCQPEDFHRAQDRGFWHRMHRRFSRPLIKFRRRLLSRYDLANTR